MHHCFFLLLPISVSSESPFVFPCIYSHWHVPGWTVLLFFLLICSAHFCPFFGLFYINILFFETSHSLSETLYWSYRFTRQTCLIFSAKNITGWHKAVSTSRRISAISVAERVAEERGEPLGKSVGYQAPISATLFNGSTMQNDW